jgi:hypothetical protein
MDGSTRTARAAGTATVTARTARTTRMATHGTHGTHSTHRESHVHTRVVVSGRRLVSTWDKHSHREIKQQTVFQTLFIVTQGTPWHALSNRRRLCLAQLRVLH